MRVGIDCGHDRLEVEVQENQLVGVQRSTPAPGLADPGAEVSQVLEKPSGFPPLRCALTPDDHVAIVIEEPLPYLRTLLIPLLEHVAQAKVDPEAITVVSPTPDSRREPLQELPEPFRKVRFEIHDPADRRHLSYLATTSQGRRVYLNRTVVDADQSIVLTRRGYDPLLGYSGGDGALYPALSDEATRQEVCGRLTLSVPGKKPWVTRQEAAEVAWLLGVPFLLQIIEGAGDEIAHIVGGLMETAQEGQRLLDARWRVTVEQPADAVVASVGGDPARQQFADLARALSCAARVVKPQGRIILLSGANPTLGEGAALIRQADEPGQALALLRQHMPSDMASAFQWASAVQQASVYLSSGLSGEIAEELFTTPLDHPRQVQRLVGEGSCVFLADAHKTLAVLSKQNHG